MNRNLKTILSILIMLVILIIISPKSQAAGIVIAFSKSTANVGDTVTVTVTGNGVTGRVDLSVTGNATLSENSIWVEGSASVNLTVNGEGDIRVTATASSMADSTTAEPYTGSTGGTITVASTTTSNPDTNTEPNTNTNPTTNTNPQTPTQPTTNPEPTKSNNANLGNFGIRPNDFTGFTPSKTEYSVTVPNDVTSVEVYAAKGQSGQTITGTGTKELQEGDNNFEVVVTAEDGTTQKTYKLTVTREASEEETPEEGATEVSEGFGLSELKIAGVELSPRFSTEVYEYTAKYTGDSDKLDITTTPTEEGTNVEITGNENLSDGENLITILVTDSSGDKTAAYQITVQKQTIDEEAIAKQEEIERQQQIRNYIIIGGAVLLVLVLIIILIIRHRRNMRYIQEYSMPYSEEDDDEYYDDNVNDDEDYEKITKKFLKNDKSSIDNEYEDKENAKNSYLNQFEDDSEYDDESMQRKRHNKGKRFK